MKENYFDYVNRIQTLIQHQACFPPADEEFKTSPNLVQKCREDGSICPFYGDTVVFQLPKSMKQYLSYIQKSLYQEHGKFLSELLPEKSLHITLHDLSASARKHEITPKIELHDNVIKSFLPSLKDKGTISLVAKGMVSMVASSIVMLFEPVDEQVHNTIQQMYESVDEICPLHYPLTLHCTLAYYKPGTYPPEEWSSLYKFISQWNSQNLDGIRFALDSDMIDYQFFCSMKNYESIVG